MGWDSKAQKIAKAKKALDTPDEAAVKGRPYRAEHRAVLLVATRRGR
jgi:hypothetical protein